MFTVEPHRAQQLTELLAEATGTVMRHRNGFRSASTRLSTDRTRGVNHAQWDSREAYPQMLSDPVAREHMGRAAALAIGFDPHLYTVESVHQEA